MPPGATPWRDVDTLSRLRLHDCPADEPADRDPLSSFDASWIDADGLDADMQRRNRERETQGLDAASDTLKTV